MVAKPNVDQYEDLENQARRSRSGRDSTRLHARPADAHDDMRQVLDYLPAKEIGSHVTSGYN